MSTSVPEGTPASVVEDTKEREAARAGELAAEGPLLRLRKPPVEPGEWRTLGLWRADDEQHLPAMPATLPPHVWMTVDVTPPVPHPSDPETSASNPS